MNYVITGAAGNISKPLSEILLSRGHNVTVIGRKEENLKELTAKGASAAIGTLEDEKFLTDSFQGADAVYVMFPPQYAALELNAYLELAKNYAAAILESGVKHIVVLSSVGAHLPEGVGPVTGLYLAEQELNKLADVNILYLRPGYFYTNLLANIPMVKGMNIIGNNSGDAKNTIILSHPADIAQAAADALEALNFKGHSVQYLVSDERPQGDLAKVLGTAVGKPDLPWVEFTDEQSLGGMIGAGLPEVMAKKYVEMGSSMRSGKMFEDYKKHPHTKGKITLEEFAKDFANAYNG
jgi:uncharacterized protein YbjT (DUF2867 family)